MKKTFKLFTLLVLLITVGFSACKNNTENKEEVKSPAIIEHETPLLKTDVINDTINGVHIICKYNIDNKYFSGSLKNTTGELIEGVNVKIYLSNGMTLDPSPATNLKPEAEYESTFMIDAEVKEWDKWDAQIEFENTEGGHGAGVTNEQRAFIMSLEFTYLLKMLK